MSDYDANNLKKYVELIARKHGGLEALRDLIGQMPRSSVTGLESLGNESVEDTRIEAAQGAVEALERGREPQPHEIDGLEAIIDADLRPVIDVVGGKYTSTHVLWTQLSQDAKIRGRLEASMPAIGRIELPGHPRLPYGGTGFVVGKGLIMTNRHVAEIFGSGLGSRSLVFKAGLNAGIDFVREIGSAPGQVFVVKRLVMIHPYWDMAVLAVEGLDSHPPLTLSLKDARDMVGHEIAVVGYPAFDPRNPADVQQNLLGGRYGVKRLQPGELQGGAKTASFGKEVAAASHDCSTLGGNSGSALIDLETGQVIALHFGGAYRARNYSVPTFELARDQRVVDAGVVFAGTPRPDQTDWADWWRRADAQESVTTPAGPLGAMRPNGELSAPPNQVTPRPQEGALEVMIPLRVVISTGAVSVRSTSVRVATETLGDENIEAMREPEHDTDYSSRRGYDPNFLDVAGAIRVPMPNASNPGVLARTKTGADVLHYQNFSLRMHAGRRIALVTACNVTKEPGLRRPEAGHDYTRKGLSGLNEGDTERWFVDSRLEERFQIPDVFFTKDRQAFDKGHICRRDDVGWGTTFEELKRANGDTYHVTNCSPQVAGFNQSAKGDENWGDLENHVLSQASSERLCVFAGPVLDAADPMFHGVGEGGKKLLSRIPRRFWKVIVSRVEEGIAAYGFVLEQDLGDVDFEFAVPDDFLPTMYRLPDIATITGVSFDQAILDADQFDSVRGIEVVQRSGVQRKP